MGLVIKSVSIEYRRPVTFPDSVSGRKEQHSSSAQLIFPSPQLVIMSTPVDIDERKASFGLKQEAWSLNQNTVVARCKSVQVMYDFENLKKGVMTPEVRQALDNIATRSLKK